MLYLSAPKENGGQSAEIPDPEQPDLRCVEQVPEVQRRGQPSCGARALLPATHPPITDDKHLNPATSGDT